MKDLLLYLLLLILINIKLNKISFKLSRNNYINNNLISFMRHKSILIRNI